MSRIIITDGKSLPRDIDVVVNMSKPQAETTTDLSVAVFCTPDAPFDHDASRIQFYSTFDAVKDVFASSSEAYKAASAWFSQSPRAKTLAIARVFDEAQNGFLQCGIPGTTVLASWKAVTGGNFKITINGTAAEVTSITFAAITELADIAGVLQTKIRAANEAAAFTGATVTIDEATYAIRITSGVAGDESAVSYLSSIATPTGTDLSGSTWLNGAYVEGAQTQSCYVVPGYLPTGIADELNYIKEAASASGKFLYGWMLDASYRDSDDQLDAAAWIEAQTAAILVLTVNSPFAYDPSSITDVGYLVKKNGYKRTTVIYHNNAYYYPEASMLSYALSVNYAAANSTITTKFKTLQGIPTVPLTVSEYSALQGKRINTYTAVGNNTRTFREGTEGDASWFIDDLINLDNFREELQVAVYNVFLQNKKVAYTVGGIAKLYAAMSGICDKYVVNGTLAERPLSDAEAAVAGYPIDAPYTVTISPLQNLTVSERASRIGPPATIKLNLAGAIHSINIGVEAYS